MRKRILLSGVLIFFTTFSIAQHCASDIYLQQRLAEDLTLTERRSTLERFTQNWITESEHHLQRRQVITIPVVFHVVWRTPEENISDAQIQSQLEVLNADFRAMNVEITEVPAIFRSAIADTEIEFCLAQTDPDGNATTGITRTQTTVAQIGTKFTDGRRAICYTDLGGRDAWNTDQYLNIWIGKTTPTFIGEASYPGMAPPAEDGIRIDYAHIGTTGTVSPPHHLGRTLTHEVGHYLNVEHPWGMGLNNPDCSKDDGIEDTPPQSTTFRNECPVHPQVFCGTASMFMNFMNYTNDACMAMFTAGQKARMLAALNGPRAGLLNATGCQMSTNAVETLQPPSFQLLQNPVSDVLRLQTDEHAPNFNLRLVNANGQTVFTDHWHSSEIYTKNVAHLPDGLYWLILQNESNFFTQKLIITH